MKKLIFFISCLLMLIPLHPLALENVPTLEINTTSEKHTIIHGSAGFLYGISNEGVPDINTLTPLKPKVLATKGALGTEHPYGDALDVADEFFESGGEQIQMYNSNYYGVFGVTANAYEYGNVLETIIAPHVASWKDTMREKYPDIDSKMVYIPINEGTPVNGVANFNEAWKIYYNAIKKADPAAVIAGPNDAVYRGHNSMYDYLKFCRDNSCLPDVISWHELQVGCLDTMDDHMADYRSICKSLGIDEVQIVINEYADYSDCGVPGRLVNWISRLENLRVYGCLPFWHQANNLNDLTSGANDGNGAWWVYKWYGDMSGKILNLSARNTSYDKFHGLASIDSQKQSISIIAGGNDGEGVINLTNIGSTSIFKAEDFVHIKVEAAHFTGYHGALGEPGVVLQGVFPIADNSVSLTLDDMLFSTAYRITVSKTDAAAAYFHKGAYHASYEAEDARHYGNLIREDEFSPMEKPRYFASGRVRMGGFDAKGDGIGYSISVPHDGLYKLSFIYGNGVGSTRNNAQTHAPKNITQSLFIDNEEDTLYLPNTLFYSMSGISEKYVHLTKGTHTIKVMFNSDQGAFHDALYVSYAGAYDEPLPSFDNIYESESADFNPESLAATKNLAEGYSGSGYITDVDLVETEAMGGVRHIVHIPQSGLYNIAFRYMAEDSGTIRIFLDNTNLTFTNHLTDIEIKKTDSWEIGYTTIFLRQGLNIIDYDTTVASKIDYMRVLASDDNQSVTYEAEDSLGSFQTLHSGDVTYVAPIKGDENSFNTEGGYFEFDVTVPSDGLYKMQVFQSNNDLCGTHSYNIKIIDRYASFMVNGDKANAKRYFFPNSFSDDTFLERTIPVTLTEGLNTIRVYNDNSWNVLWGGSTSEPGTNELVNYTPNFDKFIITPAVTDSPLNITSYKIELSATDNGYIYADKNIAFEGDKVTVSLLPDGFVTGFVVNGTDKLSSLKTEDGNIYTYTFTAEGDSVITASFSPSEKGDFTPGTSSSLITIDGKVYQKLGENLFTNPTFSDNSGNGLDAWYVGTNTQGHPSDASYQMPKINPDGTYENLIPLTRSGYLTTGVFEKDRADTFYFGRDNSRTYLVEHMASDWKACAWNGNKSLLSFIPIKENTNYYFSFDAFTVSGKVSVRFGAVDMDEENFYIPANYKTGDSLNFTSTAFDCKNGDMQNVGGKWTTHTLAFNSGEGADYFLFNAYWLHMAEYLCIGNFTLYELSSEAETEIVYTETLPMQFTVKGDALTLPTSVLGEDETGKKVTVEIKWLNPEIVNTEKANIYTLTGTLLPPDGYYLMDSYITLKVNVSDNLCSISSWDVNNATATVFIDCYKDAKATLFTAQYDADTLKTLTSYPVDLIKDETITIDLPLPPNDELSIFIWDKSSVYPLSEIKTLD